jgi:hypothetical protein
VRRLFILRSLPPRSSRLAVFGPTFRSPWFRPEPAIGPRSGPNLRRSPPRLGVSIVPMDCSSICTTRDHTSIVGPGAFAVGGRILRQRGLEVAEGSSWISPRIATGLTVEPFFAHFRVPRWKDQCADHGVSKTRARRPRRPTPRTPSIVMGTPRLVQGPDPPRLQREQWPPPHSHWPPCRQGLAPRRPCIPCPIKSYRLRSNARGLSDAATPADGIIVASGS